MKTDQLTPNGNNLSKWFLSLCLLVGLSLFSGSGTGSTTQHRSQVQIELIDSKGRKFKRFSIPFHQETKQQPPYIELNKLENWSNVSFFSAELLKVRFLELLRKKQRSVPLLYFALHKTIVQRLDKDSFSAS